MYKHIPYVYSQKDEAILVSPKKEYPWHKVRWKKDFKLTVLLKCIWEKGQSENGNKIKRAWVKLHGKRWGGGGRCSWGRENRSEHKQNCQALSAKKDLQRWNYIPLVSLVSTVKILINWILLLHIHEVHFSYGKAIRTNTWKHHWRQKQCYVLEIVRKWAGVIISSVWHWYKNIQH